MFHSNSVKIHPAACEKAARGSFPVIHAAADAFVRTASGQKQKIKWCGKDEENNYCNPVCYLGHGMPADSLRR
jgi:hypothetical protein